MPTACVLDSPFAIEAPVDFSYKGKWQTSCDLDSPLAIEAPVIPVTDANGTRML